MRVLFLSVELAPWWKVGGLADVAAALPRALSARGHEVVVATPRHRGPYPLESEVRALEQVAEALPLEVPGPGMAEAAVLRDVPAGDGRPRRFWIDAPERFERDEVYGGEDEAERFAFFTRAALVACEAAGFRPDIVHANDWHTALAPLEVARRRGRDALARSATVLTLHNVGYQGVVEDADLPRLGIPSEELAPDDRLGGRVSLLAMGIRRADALTTVSPTYAREVLTPEQGMGLEPLLQARAGDLVGILNGVDTEVWNPATDPHLATTYSAEDPSGKARCRETLLSELGLAPDPQGPVLGMISRLVWQKGIDLLPDVLPRFLEAGDTRVVVLGAGDPDCMRFLTDLAARRPDRVAFVPGEREPLAHRIEAGSDLFLMPSRYEPCGLNQMYSQLYGTLPVAHATGGLRDTIEDMDPSGVRGTGFLFSPFGVEPCLAALDRALRLFERRDVWERALRRVMRLDRSWGRAAREYERLYERVTRRGARTDVRSRPST